MIYFAEKTIYGAWVVYGSIGIRQYYCYSRAAALDKYKEECTQKLFYNKM